MALSQPEHIDTVIVGNGPSALILSYILHGNIPYYSYGHPDASLHEKLRSSRNLLDVPLSALAVLGGSLKYSTQALSINTLLDTLIRPGGDTNPSTHSCVEWRAEPKKAVEHVVLGDAPRAGGQWSSNPVEASWDIGTLSYAEQLSLPGYTIADHWKATKGERLQELHRPTRAEVAEYFAHYPEAVGIKNAVRNSSSVRGVHRSANGFILSTHGRHIHCKRLVLASGIYTINNPPPPLLTSLTTLSGTWLGPVLVIGSGFTAADIIMSTPPDRKILHIFNWDPEKNPSPLKACHPAAYPEYAAIYLHMKAAAERLLNAPWRPTRQAAEKMIATSPVPLPEGIAKRNWMSMYEGLPNARIMSTGSETNGYVDLIPATTPKFTGDEKGRRRSLFHHGPRRSSSIDQNPQRSASVDATSGSSTPVRLSIPGHPILGNKAATIRIGYSSIGESISRTISAMQYVTGRSGTLSYLSPNLLLEVLPHEKRLSLQVDDQDLVRDSFDMSDRRRSSNSDLHDFAVEYKAKRAQITSSTLREKMEEPMEGFGLMQVARDVFVVGSLTGDSLVRFAYGGCCAVAGQLMRDSGIELDHGEPLSADLALPLETPASLKSPEEKQLCLAPSVAMQTGTVSEGKAIEESKNDNTKAEPETTLKQHGTDAAANGKASGGRKKGQRRRDKCIVQ